MNDMENALKLMYITNDVLVAKTIDEIGVDRVWIDLETLGKEDRQKGLNTVKSNHSFEDISKIKPILRNSELLVRINPINKNSEFEVNEAINRGADILMLPMFKTMEEVDKFLSFTKNKSINTSLLLETKEALHILPEILNRGGFDELHVGLNDLHLSYNLTFMFELLSNGTVEYICKHVAKAGIPFGFGGIAKIGEGLLPAEKIITEHKRLGSSRAILSRSFCDNKIEDYKKWYNEFRNGYKDIRKYEQFLASQDDNFFQKNTESIKQDIEKIVTIIKGRKI